jgi:hypothetical protein
VPSTRTSRRTYITIKANAQRPEKFNGCTGSRDQAAGHSVRNAPVSVALRSRRGFNRRAEVENENRPEGRLFVVAKSGYCLRYEKPSPARPRPSSASVAGSGTAIWGVASKPPGLIDDKVPLLSQYSADEKVTAGKPLHTVDG